MDDAWIVEEVQAAQLVVEDSDDVIMGYLCLRRAVTELSNVSAANVHYQENMGEVIEVNLSSVATTCRVNIVFWALFW